MIFPVVIFRTPMVYCLTLATFNPILLTGVVLRCHEAIVFNGYQGWTTQRSSAGGIFGREWSQHSRMFCLRCHTGNFELTKPASWGSTKTSLLALEVLGSISGLVLVVSLMVKRTDYRCRRSGA